jgi:riboflavin biosynthesis pyrimidine reductase
VIISRLLPPGDPIDSAALDGLYTLPRADWLRINLISSVDGRAAGADGTSNSLTGGADRTVLGTIRRAADVVLVGASSVRAEGYVLPKTAALAVVTSTGDLGEHRLSGAEPGRLIVLCPASAVPELRRSLGDTPAEIVQVDAAAPGIPADAVISALRDRGRRSIVCEGGPSLAGQLLASGLVDELCLSTAPVIVGAGPSLLGEAAASTSLRLTQLLADEAGFQYARWATDRR